MDIAGIARFFFSSRGRIGRARFWLFVSIFVVGILLMLALVSIIPDPGEPLKTLLQIAFALVMITLVSGLFAIGVKRLHDRDHSGWMVLFFYGAPGVIEGFFRTREGIGLLLPITAFAISVWALVELGFLRGTVGENRFGPDPLQTGKQPSD